MALFADGTSAVDLTPSRIVSLSPAITEVLFELGVGSQVVGTTEHSDHPPEAKKIKRVGAYQRPSLEKILALKPDLILVGDEGPDQITASLSRFGLKQLTFRMRRLDDFETVVMLIGGALSIQSRAKQLVQNFKSKLKSIDGSCRGQVVVISLERHPFIVVGEGTFLDDILTLCGCKNGVTASSSSRVLVRGYRALNSEEKKLLPRHRGVELVMPLPKQHQDLVRLGPRLPEAIKSFCAELSRPELSK